jgi:hypothetical protein
MFNHNNNLPPGCSVSDIDRAAGAYPAECERCGERVAEACTLDENGFCDTCHRAAMIEERNVNKE